MKIGIIGASLAGLTAGKELALAGHEVTIVERSRALGGRLATYDAGDGNIFDYGISHFDITNHRFDSFVDLLVEKGEIARWASRFEYFDGTQLHDVNPNQSAEECFAAPKGMAAIAKRLSRWVDTNPGETAGGLTYIGAGRTRKRSWMINLTNAKVVECDAVVLATPATEAYGILQTAQDETSARRIIRHIDEIKYDPQFTVMATYEGRDIPEWKAIESIGGHVGWIINESSKRKNKDCSLVVQSSGSFARKYRDDDPLETASLLLEKAAGISGEAWIKKPSSVHTHYWKYANCQNPLDEEFMELEMDEAPLALVGDYLGGNNVESAHLSGLKLAEYWIQKYEMAEV